MRIYWYWPFARREELGLAEHLPRSGDHLLVHAIGANELDRATPERFELRTDLPAVSNSSEHTPRWAFDRARTYVGRARRRRDCLADGRFDVAHLMFLNYFTDPIDVPRLERRVPLVATVHDVVPHQRRLPTFVQDTALARLYRTLPMVVVHHRHVGSLLTERFGVDGDRIRVVPYPVHPLVDGRDRHRPAEPTELLFFGAMRRNKGVGVLLDAIGELAGRDDLVFRFAGRGFRDVEESIRAASRRDPRVRPELGWVAPARKAELLADSAIVVLPYTEFDSQSAVLLDAYAAGRPVMVERGGLPRRRRHRRRNRLGRATRRCARPRRRHRSGDSRPRWVRSRRRPHPRGRTAAKSRQRGDSTPRPLRRGRAVTSMPLRAGARLKTSVRLGALRVVRPRRHDPSRTVLVAGSARSGTTWLAELLSSIPRSAVLFEPLHETQVPAARRAGFTGEGRLASELDWPAGRTYLDDVLRGRILTPWTTREVTVAQVARAHVWIVKVLGANSLLSSIARTWPVPGPVLMIRHPGAVVESQLAHGWTGATGPVVPRDLASRFPGLSEAVARASTPAERLAARWAVENLQPLHEPPGRPWTLVPYEHLVREPEQILHGLFGGWRWPVPPDLLAELDRPSMTARRGGDVEHRLHGWRDRLGRDRTARVLEIVRACGITVYDEGDEPRLDRLPSRSSVAHPDLRRRPPVHRRSP